MSFMARWDSWEKWELRSWKATAQDALLLAREALEAVEGDWVGSRVTCYWCGFEPAPEGERPPFEPGGQHRPDCRRERALALIREVPGGA